LAKVPGNSSNNLAAPVVISNNASRNMTAQPAQMQQAPNQSFQPAPVNLQPPIVMSNQPIQANAIANSQVQPKPKTPFGALLAEMSQKNQSQAPQFAQT